MANVLTVLRIVGTLVLFLLTPASTGFYIVYLISGVTDVLDGMIARLTKTTSLFGAKLDSVADLFFYAVMIIRLMPILWEKLPVWIWVLAGLVIAVRLCSYVTAYHKSGTFSALHTKLNKLTGLSVFLIPFCLTGPILTPYCVAVCIIGMVSSTHELTTHLCAAREIGEKELS